MEDLEQASDSEGTRATERDPLVHHGRMVIPGAGLLANVDPDLLGGASRKLVHGAVKRILRPAPPTGPEVQGQVEDPFADAMGNMAKAIKAAMKMIKIQAGLPQLALPPIKDPNDFLINGDESLGDYMHMLLTAESGSNEAKVGAAALYGVLKTAQSNNINRKQLLVSYLLIWRNKVELYAFKQAIKGFREIFEDPYVTICNRFDEDIRQGNLTVAQRIVSGVIDLSLVGVTVGFSVYEAVYVGDVYKSVIIASACMGGLTVNAKGVDPYILRPWNRKSAKEAKEEAIRLLLDRTNRYIHNMASWRPAGAAQNAGFDRSRDDTCDIIASMKRILIANAMLDLLHQKMQTITKERELLWGEDTSSLPQRFQSCIRRCNPPTYDVPPELLEKYRTESYEMIPYHNFDEEKYGQVLSLILDDLVKEEVMVQRELLVSGADANSIKFTRAEVELLPLDGENRTFVFHKGHNTLGGIKYEPDTNKQRASITSDHYPRELTRRVNGSHDYNQPPSPAGYQSFDVSNKPN